MSTQVSKELLHFEHQKFFAERLCEKIEYLKRIRLQIPASVIIGNFSILHIYNSLDALPTSQLIFAFTFCFISFVGVVGLWFVRRSFKQNIDSLEYIYRKMGFLTEDFVPTGHSRVTDKAAEIWWLLYFLVVLAAAIPSVLVMCYLAQ